ncbi:hypothetical protein BLNAU_7215 [Blattamonas nauphoetae]|uniref:Uncharacterized protein n=1 Tax=Blattamonas nauphoetae TaxID=2049346 RepID=A0ABQ9Y206_9EUKA|nr:hypothetical protein BLNAU_7215 [Blattamonas nauphoetae]
MRNSITPTLLQTSSLLNTVVTLFRAPSIPLQTTEWTPQHRWHDRNWTGQPSRSSAGIGFRAGPDEFGVALLSFSDVEPFFDGTRLDWPALILPC